MSAFLRRSHWAKSDSEIPVSTPSRFKVSKFGSLICGHDQLLSTKESVLAKIFSIMYFLTWLFRYVGFFKVRCFRSFGCVTEGVFKLSFCIEAGTKTTAPCEGKSSNGEMTKNFFELEHVFGCQKKSSAFPSCSFERKHLSALLQKLSRDVFLCFASSIERFPSTRFTMHSQRNLMNLFQQVCAELLLILQEKDWNTWRAQRFCEFTVQGL